MPCLTMLLHTIGVTPTAAGAVSHSGSASDARTPVEGSRPSQPEANPATAGPSGGFPLTLHTNTHPIHANVTPNAGRRVGQAQSSLWQRVQAAVHGNASEELCKFVDELEMDSASWLQPLHTNETG